MDFDAAWKILARAAGDDLANFLGEPRDRVPESDVQEAAQWLLAEISRSEPLEMVGRSDEEKVELMIREARAQAFEAWWHSTGKRYLKKRGSRTRVLTFLETQTGRPMPAHSR